jgi:hypothetical protein
MAVIDLAQFRASPDAPQPEDYVSRDQINAFLALATALMRKSGAPDEVFRAMLVATAKTMTLAYPEAGREELTALAHQLCPLLIGYFCDRRS